MLPLAPIAALIAAAPPPLPAPAPAPAQKRWPGAARALDDAADQAVTAATRGDRTALARVYRLWNLSAMIDRPDQVAKALDAIIAARRVDPLTRAHALYLRADLLLRAGLVDEAARARRELGLVTDAQLIGPFDNSAGNGHGAQHPPELALDLDGETAGMSHPLRWRSIAGLAPFGVIELSELLRPSRNATAFALFAVSVPAPVRAAIRVGATDQVKVFVDGEPVFAADRIGHGALDQHSFGVALGAGAHVVMVKVSWGDAAAKLIVRVTEPAGGGALPGAVVSADRAALDAAIAAASRRPKTRPASLAVADVQSSLARARPTAHILALRSDLYALLGLYDRRKLPPPPQVDLHAAIHADPADPSLRFFYAHRVEGADRAIAKRQLVAALASDPGHAPSLVKLAGMARSSALTIEARAHLERAIASDPTFLQARISMASLRFDNPFERDLAVAALAAAPGIERSPEALSELARRREGLGDAVGAKAAAKACLRIDERQDEARALLIRAARDAGDQATVLAHIDRGLALEPWSLRLRLDKARALAMPGTQAALTAALASLQDAGPTFGDIADLWDFAAQLSLELGDTEGGLASLEKSLTLDPHRTAVRRHRAFLANRKTELEDAFSLDPADLRDTPVDPEEEKWGAVMLAERTAVRLFPSGQSSRFKQLLIRVHKAEIGEQLRTHRVSFSPSRERVEVLTAERIRPNLEIVKARRVSEQGPRGKVSGMYIDARSKRIQFDRVEAGDIIHIRYRVDSIGENLFGGFFGHIEPVQSGLPKRNVQIVALAPASRQLYPASMRAPEPTVTVTDDVQRTEWSFDRVPALDSEPFAPPYAERAMMVSLSTYSSWSELAHWYAGLFRDQMELDDAARAQAKAVVEGVTDEREKIRRLYNYVVKNTRYVGIELGIHGWKPFNATEVHRRRYGDCKDKATLLASLLRENGVDATIALVRTADRGRIPPDHATMWAFNHAITYVPSQELFLDGTAEFSGSTELPYLDQGAMALVVHPDGTSQLTEPAKSPPSANTNRSSYTATLAPDGSMSLVGEETFRGARAARLRQEYEEPRLRRTRLEKVLGQVLPGVRVLDAAFSDLSDLEAPASYRYEAKVDKHGVREDGTLRVPLTLFPHRVAEAYAGLAEREEDMRIDYAWTTTNVIRYALPSGMTVKQLPQSDSVDNPFISLQQTVQAVDGGYETIDTLTLKTDRIAAADYPAFRAACLAIDRALERDVIIEVAR